MFCELDQAKPSHPRACGRDFLVENEDFNLSLISSCAWARPVTSPWSLQGLADVLVRVGATLGAIFRAESPMHGREFVKGQT